MSLSNEEKQLISELGFCEVVVEELKKDMPDVVIKKLEHRLYDMEKVDLDYYPKGVKITPNVKFQGANTTELQLDGLEFELLGSGDTSGVELVKKWQKNLLAKGYLLFLYSRGFKNTDSKSLALWKSSDPLDMLKMTGTNGCNCEIYGPEVVETIRSWWDKASFELMGAGNDWAVIYFQKLPENVEEFAKEVYHFCPDVVEQGYIGPPLGPEAGMEEYMEAYEEQSPDDLVDYLRREMALSLWWD